MRLTREIIETLEGQRPIPIATCLKPNTPEENAIPNLIYVSSIRVFDEETIMIADNKFFKTKMNLLDNPEIAIAVYNPTTNKSYQMKGTVTIYTEGEIFEQGVQWMEDKKQLRVKKTSIVPKSIVLVHIREIYGKGKVLKYINGEPVFEKEE